MIGFIEIAKKFNCSDIEIETMKKVNDIYPVLISDYYASLIKEKNDAIWNQCMPDIKEINSNTLNDDNLDEEKSSPVKCIVHRYPDRVLFLVSSNCDMYCRFCTRKRKVGKTMHITNTDILDGIKYITLHPEIRDVILSGGDPLLLPLNTLDFILKSIKTTCPHVDIIRIGTRLPCVNPDKITIALCSMLKQYAPIYINVHFEHPSELTSTSAAALNLLADYGFVLGNQNVLLKNINNNDLILKELYQKLIKNRVKPYYMFQNDNNMGTSHFTCSINEGLSYLHKIQGWTSGLCIPHYVYDSYEGKGKIMLENADQLQSEYVLNYKNEKVKLEHLK